MTRPAPSPDGSPPRLPDRRTFLGAAAGAAASVLAAPVVLGQAAPQVVVIGGGFGGASCAVALKRQAPSLAVTLIEPKARYVACPFSNGVIAGLRPMQAQEFSYDGLTAHGIKVVAQAAAGIDPEGQRVRLEDGSELPYDRLVMAPGIELKFDALPGYDAKAAERMPHAWQAGAQTELLTRQLEAMEDGGLVAISAPANPFRCPPGPYERASLVAHYLKTRKPRSKLLILDAKDAFSKQKLFEQAWGELYPGLIEWVSLSFGGAVIEVDPSTMTLTTDFGQHRAAVANVIPPQRAGAIARTAGVADDTGWCPIDPYTFESPLQAGIHVIGDAAIAGAMPKSAFAANAQAKACATAVIAMVQGQSPQAPKLVNTCYSLCAPDYGISIAGVYQPQGGVLAEVEGAGGVSPLDASREFREREAHYAEAWYQTITTGVFG